MHLAFAGIMGGEVRSRARNMAKWGNKVRKEGRRDGNKREHNENIRKDKYNRNSKTAQQSCVLDEISRDKYFIICKLIL
jgi:hypothetical protein